MKKELLKKVFGLAMAAALTLGATGCTQSQPAEEPQEAADGGAAETEQDTSGDTAGDAAWPAKTLTIVVPFNAGGDTDFHARNLASYLEKELGITVIVSNVAGANGTTGMLQVAGSAPDGATALFFHESMLTNKVTGIAETAHENLEPVAATIVDNSYVMAVNSKSGLASLDDVVNAAKGNPGNMLYASSVGGYSYYLGRQLEEMAGIDFNIVDAGGGTDRNAALLASKIDTNVNPYGVMKAYFDSGDFTAVCTIAEERNPLFPDVPTAKEQGYDWIGERYYFMSFPKGTDQALVDTMADAIENVVANPEFVQKTEEAYSVSPTYVGPDELKAHLDSALNEFTENIDLVMN